ncbi:MAG: benzoyl-CoA-dihydrodiol lyase [Rhodospirillaceae bacterium]|mgnify:FL=1|jgi:benzoyl-CoA-dihydrodiol lyase|nr:benzoyl-CoA-dihydrodiol lyase [Rhodospirillaceae bacterium]MBT5243839.1 benzoyl-CoA-dihydrodiol lyase [Rhodospirillaceae bacterium]MBT5562888.1 benzoyl-CoA-dihydrodiol lyase [Rhodospirillaceae bacterium]MBT6241287.1 benzoyl-CoA-dihydrodiol lyase [Rhodospirillaceae bacterium]MBT7138750.1 benzoyl-CoA-dihydrodiol lyase [Rhodospirillaceae bacterium]
MIDFTTHPDMYKHWKLSFDGPVATLTMDVDEDCGLKPDYKLKLNSYDLGVDIELYDAVQRLRFEHPEVRCVVITSAKDRVFCSGANITMLGSSSHAEKVNFCKFTNETRNGIEDATENSAQSYICSINGTAAGGGYELALAADHIILIDDGSSAVSLPEVPLLAVLPGTGGLTRVVDKRMVRRDHADFFCTLTEGIKGKRSVQWKLVDEIVPRSSLEETTRKRALEFAEKSDRPEDAKGIELTAPNRKIDADAITYDNVSIQIIRDDQVAMINVSAPPVAPPSDLQGIHAQGVEFWPLALARELDDAILHLRTNEAEIGTWVFTTSGEADLVDAADKALLDHADDWLVREITLYMKRVFKRIDVTSRSLISLVEPGSCFSGTLLELLLVADRSFMLDGVFEGDNRAPATVRPGSMNFGPLPMCNGLTRLETRFLGEAEALAAARAESGNDLDAEAADEIGLVTFIPDDIDWQDEVRIAIEERASFSPDCLTGMEASLRFAGPETLETKIFGRLSAWQNWIFQRPNAVGEEGALKRFGTGLKASYDNKRV